MLGLFVSLALNADLCVQEDQSILNSNGTLPEVLDKEAIAGV